MDSGELAEGNDIVLRDVTAHSLEQSLDIFRLPRLDFGDYCERHLMRHNSTSP